MYTVYLLRSISHTDQRYIGITEDLDSRFTAHNNGQSPHTAKFKPWKIVVAVSLSDESRALEFGKIPQVGGRSSFRESVSVVIKSPSRNGTMSQ